MGDVDLYHRDARGAWIVDNDFRWSLSATSALRYSFGPRLALLGGARGEVTPLFSRTGQVFVRFDWLFDRPASPKATTTKKQQPSRS